MDGRPVKTLRVPQTAIVKGDARSFSIAAASVLAKVTRDRQMLDAAWVSLRIAFWTASAATVIGTLGAMVMTRFRRFPGKTVFGALVTAPLVMPEVITGLSLLLLFVTLEQLFGWPEGRGMTTIILAHVTFAMAFVTVIVQSRLAQFDESLEEAAQDLGARPAKVFFLVTLPIIFPALLSGWLLAFTLSLDDLVITSFVAVPGSSTLPMVIFSKVRLGVSPDINALATILVAPLMTCSARLPVYALLIGAIALPIAAMASAGGGGGFM